MTVSASSADTTSQSVATRTPSHRGVGRTFAISLSFAFVAAFAFNLVWWGLLSPEANAAQEAVITIPAGTAASVAGGATGVFLPGLELAPGGTLRVQNDDVVDHTIGDYTIPAGKSISVSAPEASAQFNCSITGSGVLGLHILKRPPLLSTLVPSALLGVPLGLLLAAAIVIASRLNLDPPPIRPA